MGLLGYAVDRQGYQGHLVYPLAVAPGAVPVTAIGSLRRLMITLRCHQRTAQTPALRYGAARSCDGCCTSHRC